MQALVLQLPFEIICESYTKALNKFLYETSGRMRAFLLVASYFDEDAIDSLSRHEHLEYTVVAQRKDKKTDLISQHISLNRKYNELLVFGTAWAKLYLIHAADDTFDSESDADQQINDVAHIWLTFDPLSLTFRANENVEELVSPFVKKCAGLKHATLLHETFRITVRNVNDSRSIDVIITSLAAIRLIRELPSYVSDESSDDSSVRIEISDDGKLAYNLVFMETGGEIPLEKVIFPLTRLSAIETMQFENQLMFKAFLEYLAQNVERMKNKFFEGLNVISGPIVEPVDQSIIDLGILEGLPRLELIFLRGARIDLFSSFKIPENFQKEEDAMACYVALALINATPPNGICIRIPKRELQLVVQCEN